MNWAVCQTNISTHNVHEGEDVVPDPGAVVLDHGSVHHHHHLDPARLGAGGPAALLPTNPGGSTTSTTTQT